MSGIDNELESKRKTAQTGMEQRPALGRPRSPCGPCGFWQPTSRLGSCHKTYASSVPMLQKHQSGNLSTNRENSTKRWSDSLQVRSGGGAIRSRGVERIAPPETAEWGEAPHADCCREAAAHCTPSPLSGRRNRCEELQPPARELRLMPVPWLSHLGFRGRALREESRSFCPRILLKTHFFDRPAPPPRAATFDRRSHALSTSRSSVGRPLRKCH